MTDENKEVDNREVRGRFVDPIVATPIAIFVLKEIGKAIISFFTFKFLAVLWNKHLKERWDKWWHKENEVEKDQSDVD